jgi:hypothetical protein
VSTIKQLPIAHTLKMEAARSSETSVTIYQLTQRHISDNSVRAFFVLMNSCERMCNLLPLFKRIPHFQFLSLSPRGVLTLCQSFPCLSVFLYAPYREQLNGLSWHLKHTNFTKYFIKFIHSLLVEIK